MSFLNLMYNNLYMRMLLLSCVAVVILSLLFVHLRSGGEALRDGKRLRKAPDTLPILGNAVLFLQPRQRLFLWFTKCERLFGYETLRISVPTLPPGVIISHPQNLEFIFKHHHVFEKGEFFKERSRDTFGNGIINVDGDLWKVQRKAGLHFLSASNMKILTDVALPRYLSQSVALLKSYADTRAVVDLQVVFLEIMTQLMGNMAYGMEMHADDDFTVAFDHASEATAKRFKNPLWFITEFCFGGKFCKSLSVIKSYGKRIVSSAVANRKTSDKDGYGSHLDDVSGSLIQSLLDSISDENVVADAALNYLTAGRDTVAQALTWAFYLLMKHQHAMKRMRKQVEETLHEDKEDASLLKLETFTPRNLPYVLSVFYETLRLYPPIPFEMKQAQQDITLPDDTFLPKSSVVLWCTWAMNRSKLTWGDNADEFCLERWLTDDGGAVIHKAASDFPVFNGGSRLCLGKRMAENVAVRVIASLVVLFDFTPAYEGDRVSKDSLTLPMKGGLPVYVKRRTNVLCGMA